MSQEDYKRTTYDLTLNVGHVLARLNPKTTFCYVTGAGTDSSEKGRVAWARVKGATENALLRLFPRAYMFRPGFMRATPGQKNLKWAYKAFAWVYPIGRAVYPAMFCTLEEVGRAMINTARKGSGKRVLEVRHIVELAKGGGGLVTTRVLASGADWGRNHVRRHATRLEIGQVAVLTQGR